VVLLIAALYFRVIIGLVCIGIIVYLVVDLTDAYNLVSLAGLIAFVLVAILLSSNRSKVFKFVYILTIENFIMFI
jgi:hypothetical protein